MSISQGVQAVAGGVIVILIVLLISSRQTIATHEETIVGLKTEVELIALSNEETNHSLDVCKQVNEENAKQREEAKRKALEASNRVKALMLELEEISNERFNTSDEELAVCRRLDEPLPHDFLGWLCIDGAKNCS